MSQQEVYREFVLGRKPFFLNFSGHSDYINDMEVELQLDMCQELSIINDLLWDANNEGEQGSDLFIKIRMRLSNEKDPKTEAEMAKERAEYMKNAEVNEVLGRLKPGDGPLEEALKKQLADLSLQNKKLQSQVALLEGEKEAEAKKA